MGFSKKHQVDGESLEGKKWVIAGITMRAPLRSITTKKPKDGCWEDEENLNSNSNSNSGATTPTGKEAKIPEFFSCPPAPRKRRPVSVCHRNRNTEFFVPPDLDSIFQPLAKAERAS